MPGPGRGPLGSRSETRSPLLQPPSPPSEEGHGPALVKAGHPASGTKSETSPGAGRGRWYHRETSESKFRGDRTFLKGGEGRGGHSTSSGQGCLRPPGHTAREGIAPRRSSVVKESVSLRGSARPQAELVSPLRESCLSRLMGAPRALQGPGCLGRATGSPQESGKWGHSRGVLEMGGNFDGGHSGI